MRAGAYWGANSPIGRQAPGLEPFFGCYSPELRLPVDHHLAGVVRIGLDLELATGLVGVDRVLGQVLVDRRVIALAALELDADADVVGLVDRVGSCTGLGDRVDR